MVILTEQTIILMNSTAAIFVSIFRVFNPQMVSYQAEAQLQQPSKLRVKIRNIIIPAAECLFWVILVLQSLNAVRTRYIRCLQNPIILCYTLIMT